jgi:hypothetical protein
MESESDNVQKVEHARYMQGGSTICTSLRDEIRAQFTTIMYTRLLLKTILAVAFSSVREIH